MNLRFAFFGKPLARLIACVAIAMTAGCASINVAELPSASVDKRNAGIVLVSVTGNTARAGQFDHVVLQPVTDKHATYLLKQVSQGLARDTALFVGVLPAGEYSVVRLDVGTQFIAFGEQTRDRLGTIRVKQGGVHDLGRLVVTALNSQVLIGRSANVTSNTDMVKRFAAETAQYLEGTVDQGWTTGRNSKDRVEEYAASTPVGADSLRELPTGEVVAASRLGSILVRDTKERWRALTTGKLESLLSVAPTTDPDVRLVAAGEFNTLAQVGQDWKVQMLDPGDLPPGNLVFIAGNKQVGWYLAQQRKDTVTIYRSEQLDHGHWLPIKTESTAFSFWSGPNSFWAWPTEQGFAYAESKGTIWWFDFASRAWRETRAPNNSRISAVASNPGGALGLLTSPGGGFGGIFASNYLSTDKAQTWTEVKSPFSVLVTPPRITASGLMLTQGGVFSKAEIKSSEDAGKTWKTQSDSLDLQEQLTPLPTKGLFAVDDGRGVSQGIASIRHSGDDGKTWQLEYSNFNREFYNAQKKK
ncbi:MAG: hypothetical protein EOP38_02690 [Rubrivivax sp.]|nr:MAG: hypothetical protein EOP38_02690 [Rubrivivax sp.]